MFKGASRSGKVGGGDGGGDESGAAGAGEGGGQAGRPTIHEASTPGFFEYFVEILFILPRFNSICNHKFESYQHSGPSRVLTDLTALNNNVIQELGKYRQILNIENFHFQALQGSVKIKS